MTYQCKDCGTPCTGLRCNECRSAPKKSAEAVKIPKEKMTGPEKAMAQIMESRKRTGEVQEWWFEAVKFKVGVQRCWYTPDFFAELADGTFEVVETKGGRGALDDARVKFMAAAREHTWARWRMEKLTKTGWVNMYDYPSKAAA